MASHNENHCKWVCSVYIMLENGAFLKNTDITLNTVLKSNSCTASGKWCLVDQCVRLSEVWISDVLLYFESRYVYTMYVDTSVQTNYGLYLVYRRGLSRKGLPHLHVLD